MDSQTNTHARARRHTPSRRWRWWCLQAARTCADLGGLVPSLVCAGQHTQTNAGDEDVGMGTMVLRVGVPKQSVLAPTMLATQARGSRRTPLPAGWLGSARRLRRTHHRSLDRLTRRTVHPLPASERATKKARHAAPPRDTHHKNGLTSATTWWRHLRHTTTGMPPHLDRR
jgi:hypothetical protein